jgi:hypothetical protein
MEVSDDLTGHGGVGSAGALTLLLYPDGVTRRVKEPSRPATISLQAGGEAGPLPALGPLDQLEEASLGWAYEADRQYLWVWLPASAAEWVVRYGGGE